MTQSELDHQKAIDDYERLSIAKRDLMNSQAQLARELRKLNK